MTNMYDEGSSFFNNARFFNAEQQSGVTDWRYNRFDHTGDFNILSREAHMQ